MRGDLSSGITMWYYVIHVSSFRSGCSGETSGPKKTQNRLKNICAGSTPIVCEMGFNFSRFFQIFPNEIDCWPQVPKEAESESISSRARSVSGATRSEPCHRKIIKNHDVTNKTAIYLGYDGTIEYITTHMTWVCLKTGIPDKLPVYNGTYGDEAWKFGGTQCWDKLMATCCLEIVGYRKWLGAHRCRLMQLVIILTPNFQSTRVYLVGGLEHFLFYHNIWDNPSHWLIFFKMVKTTNQLLMRDWH